MKNAFLNQWCSLLKGVLLAAFIISVYPMLMDQVHRILDDYLNVVLTLFGLWFATLLVVEPKCFECLKIIRAAGAEDKIPVKGDVFRHFRVEIFMFCGNAAVLTVCSHMIASETALPYAALICAVMFFLTLSMFDVTERSAALSQWPVEQ